MRKFSCYGLVGILSCCSLGCLTEESSKMIQVLAMSGHEEQVPRPDIIVCPRCDLTGQEISLNPKNNTSSSRTDTNRHPKVWTGTIRP